MVKNKGKAKRTGNKGVTSRSPSKLTNTPALSTKKADLRAKSQSIGRSTEPNKKHIAKRTGDFRNSLQVSKSASQKHREVSRSRRNSSSKKKSPQLYTSKMSQFSKVSSAAKNAPKFIKKLSTRRALRQKSKHPSRQRDIQIVIETPKSKRAAGKTSRSSSPSKARESGLKSKNIIYTFEKSPVQSKTKDRMKTLSKGKHEEDDFLKKIKRVGAKKDTKMSNRASTPSKQFGIFRKLKITPKQTQSGRKSLNKFSVDEAMKSIEKIRITPRKTVRSEKSPSASRSPSRERSRVNEKVSKKLPIKHPKAVKTGRKSSESGKKTLKPKQIIKPVKKQRTPSPSESEEEQVNTHKRKPLIHFPIARDAIPAVVQSRFAKASATPIRRAVKVEKKSEIEEESKRSRSRSNSQTKRDLSESKSKERKMIKKPVQHAIGYSVDTKGISEEISKIIKRIEEKKKRGFVSSSAEKSRGGAKNRVIVTKKLSAKDYGYKLQKNPNIKVNHFVKLKDLIEKPVIKNTDILLALLEIAYNSEHYQIAFSNKSKMFWEDVVKYSELQKIFSDLKPETLRKYWQILSQIPDVDVEKIADLIKKHKKFLDDIPIRLLSIIVSVKHYITGQVKDFEEYIKHQSFEVRSRELFEEEEVDPETGFRKIIQTIRTTTKTRNKYEEKIKREWNGKNYAGPINEILEKKKADPGSYLDVLNKINEEDGKNYFYIN